MKMWPSTVTTCAICGSVYVTDDLEDVQLHAARHAEFVLAEATLGYAPMPAGDHESVKDLGREIIRTSWSLATRIKGALLVLRAWFDRSLEAAIGRGYWRVHLTFDEYASKLELESDFPPDVVTALRRTYVARAIRGVLVGTYWMPVADR